MWTWGAIVFAIGIALMIADTVMAAKKKEGITPTDRRRIIGLFWITLFASGLVMGLVWMS